MTHEKHIHIWKAPGFTREFAPFVIHKKFQGHYDDVTTISWSEDSKFFVTGSLDFTVRVFALDPVEGIKGTVLSGHKDKIIGAWFTPNNESIYSVSKDGSLFVWKLKYVDEKGVVLPDQEEITKKIKLDSSEPSPLQMWRSESRHYFNQNHAHAISASFHAASGLLVVGFSSGIFGLW